MRSFSVTTPATATSTASGCVSKRTFTMYKRTSIVAQQVERHRLSCRLFRVQDLKVTDGWFNVDMASRGCRRNRPAPADGAIQARRSARRVDTWSEIVDGSGIAEAEIRKLADS
jgi:hypothetical protein